jgi:hypothetical protein
MKHLKKFNESLQSDEIDELKDFCETSLAYLLDEGYNVSVSMRDQVKYPEKQHTIVSLGLDSKYSEFQTFDWNDVKDYYIPFLQMLVRRYELLPYTTGDGRWKIEFHGYVCFNTELGFRYLSLDQVINDSVGPYCSLWGINLKIVDKI